MMLVSCRFDGVWCGRSPVVVLLVGQSPIQNTQTQNLNLEETKDLWVIVEKEESRLSRCKNKRREAVSCSSFFQLSD
ncbi:hypothetical protein QVD17_39437 [Tagetes erecta]|uniref:Uncharacterized protein n=1 Tax=Tagetes erecta TaxID=13708 RepID=A0AAD8JNJ1_TARER|nr:hypothetical protein QVD17_39437 [Tagetes erecta]